MAAKMAASTGARIVPGAPGGRNVPVLAASVSRGRVAKNARPSLLLSHGAPAYNALCQPEPTDLRTGNAEAEIVADRFVTDPKYYYVAHPRQSRSLLGWGIESNFERAVQQSDALLRSAT